MIEAGAAGAKYAEPFEPYQQMADGQHDYWCRPDFLLRNAPSVARFQSSCRWRANIQSLRRSQLARGCVAPSTAVVLGLAL